MCNSIDIDGFGQIKSVKPRNDGNLYAFVDFTYPSAKKQYANLIQKQNKEQEELRSTLKIRLDQLRKLEDRRMNATPEQLKELNRLREIDSIDGLNRQILEIQFNLSEKKDGNRNIYIVPIGEYDYDNNKILVTLKVQDICAMRRLAHMIFRRHGGKYRVTFS